MYACMYVSTHVFGCLHAQFTIALSNSLLSWIKLLNIARGCSECRNQFLRRLYSGQGSNTDNASTKSIACKAI